MRKDRPGRVRTWSGSRPYPAAWARRFCRNATPAAMSAGRREHRVGVPGGQRHARRRRAGLGQERVALRRARERQIAGHVEVLAVVPGRVQPGRVGPLAGLPGPDRGVVFPGVPELEHDLDVFAGPLVPVRGRGVRLVAEVARGGGLGGGDDVPAGASVAEEVQRGQPPGHVPRVAVGGGHGGDQPDLLGGGGHRGEQLQRVQPGVGQVLGAEFGHPGAVGQEDRVEHAAFGRPRQLDVVGAGPARWPGRRARPARRPRGIRSCAGTRSGSGSGAQEATSILTCPGRCRCRTERSIRRATVKFCPNGPWLTSSRPSPPPARSPARPRRSGWPGRTR